MTATPILTPPVAALVETLELQVSTVVEGFLGGLHRSPFRGHSSEFDSYRPYIQGDNLRHIDWKVWGRTDKFYIKQFEDETNLSCHLILDRSASMDMGTEAGHKFAYARLLTAALAYLMHRQHDASGLILCGGGESSTLPPATKREHLSDIFHLLASTTPSGLDLTPDNWPTLLAPIRRQGLSIVISDFFCDIENTQNLLKRLRAQRQEVLIFQIVTPEECDFPYRGPVRLEELETGRFMDLDAPFVRAQYQKRFRAFCTELEQLCARYESSFCQWRTDEPLEKALIAYFMKRTGL